MANTNTIFCIFLSFPCMSWSVPRPSGCVINILHYTAGLMKVWMTTLHSLIPEHPVKHRPAALSHFLGVRQKPEPLRVEFTPGRVSPDLLHFVPQPARFSSRFSSRSSSRSSALCSPGCWAVLRAFHRLSLTLPVRCLPRHDFPKSSHSKDAKTQPKKRCMDPQ